MTARVTIHGSRFPEAVRRGLLKALRARRFDQAFHYETPKQASKWLALHEAYSPARRDDDCLKTYARAFRGAAALVPGKNVYLLGLACGGGQKEARLLHALTAAGKNLSFTATDASLPLALTTLAAAKKFVPEKNLSAHVFDVILDGALGSELGTQHSKLITLFGALHTFEPAAILPRLTALMRPRDHLLVSANLAPGADYAAGVEQIFPQYDNALTRDWLATGLYDLGVERGDGAVRFSVQRGQAGLRRVQADFYFARARAFKVYGEEFRFRRGDTLELFFSYRYTSDRLRNIVQRYGLEVRHEWLAASGEEGVFLCQRL